MHIFAELPASCEVRVSCTELYNDTLYDLLTRGAPTRLRETAQRESGGARLLIVRTATELIEAVRNAELRRHISQRTRHSLLARSHRGHLFLTIHVGTPAANDAAEAIAAGGIGGAWPHTRRADLAAPAAGSPGRARGRAIAAPPRPATSDNWAQAMGAAAASRSSLRSEQFRGDPTEQLEARSINASLYA